MRERIEIQRAGIVANPKVDKSYAERLSAALEKKGIEVVVGIETSQSPPVESSVDLIFVLGGDGTMLRASKMYPGKLLLGVNLGTVGFMSGMRPEDIESGVDKVLDGGLHVQDYRLLEVKVEGEETRQAVNDAVLVKPRPHQITAVEVSVGGERLVSYQLDGLVAATPLGSTAYALSAGGPIISGDVGCYVLVPIAPHSLARVPMVLGENEDVEITLTERPALLSLDGDEPQEIPAGGTIRIGLSKESVRIGRTDEWTWWRAVRRTFL